MIRDYDANYTERESQNLNTEDPINQVTDNDSSYLKSC